MIRRRKHEGSAGGEGGGVPDAEPRRRVLVTGAAGRIGSYFAEHSADRYDLRLMLHPEKDDEATRAKFERLGEVVTADLGDFDRICEVCRDVHTVLHLAADPSPNAGWGSLLPNNIIGAYHIFAAADKAVCERVIYASSIHAVSGHPVQTQVRTNDPVNPGDLYGVSKCFGEALARYYAEQQNLTSIVVRIGAFQPLEAAREEKILAHMDAFVSPRDLTQLFHRCIDARDINFAIVHGLSNNRFNRMDIESTKELLDYSPADDVTEINPTLDRLDLRDSVGDHRAG